MSNRFDVIGIDDEVGFEDFFFLCCVVGSVEVVFDNMFFCMNGNVSMVGSVDKISV